MGYGLDDQVSIPGIGKFFSLFHSVETGSEVDPASYPMDTGGPFLGSKEAEA
jgi:hypothetical protein